MKQDNWPLYAAAALRTDSELGTDSRLKRACEVADRMVELDHARKIKSLSERLAQELTDRGHKSHSAEVLRKALIRGGSTKDITYVLYGSLEVIDRLKEDNKMLRSDVEAARTGLVPRVVRGLEQHRGFAYAQCLLDALPTVRDPVDVLIETLDVLLLRERNLTRQVEKLTQDQKPPTVIAEKADHE